MEKTKKQKKGSRNRGRNITLTVMALPAVLFFLINNYLPLLGTFIAFKKIDYRKGLWGSDWVGWENFKYLFSTKDMWIITRNTILYNLAFIVVGIMFSVLLALMLNEISGKIAPKFYQTSIIVPSMVSAAIVGYCVFAFLSPTSGFLTKALEQFGIGKINWYLDPKPWPIILIVVHIWKNCGYNSIVYLASIVGIDKSFCEAASLDGASRWQKIRYITLPMIKPTVITMTLMSLGKIFYADFGLFYQVPMGSGAISETTNVIDVYVYNALMQTGDISRSAAAGLYQTVVGFIVVLLSNYAVKKVSEEHALF